MAETITPPVLSGEPRLVPGVAEAARPGILTGKRGLIMGVANNRSIAWGIARAAHQHGAALALTYQGDALKKRVEPLARELDAAVVGHCDVTEAATMDAVFAEVGRLWGGLDFLVHAIAFSDKDELTGRYVDTSERNFTKSLLVSCYSFTAVAQRAEKLMANGGSLLTLTYYGAEKWMPHYNVMGIAKAALEASVRYLGRADQDARGVGHRRLPLHPALERVQLALAAHGHDRRGRRHRSLSRLRHGERHDRRDPPRRRRLSRRRHEEPGGAGHDAGEGLSGGVAGAEASTPTGTLARRHELPIVGIASRDNGLEVGELEMHAVLGREVAAPEPAEAVGDLHELEDAAFLARRG